MCGRFSLIADLGDLARRFEFDGNLLNLEPNYNVAPTQNVLTVVGGANRHGGLMRDARSLPLATQITWEGRRDANDSETCSEVPGVRRCDLVQGPRRGVSVLQAAKEVGETRYGGSGWDKLPPLMTRFRSTSWNSI